MKIAKIQVAFEVPDDFAWGDPDILDKITDMICKVNHNEDTETPCNMISASGRIMTEEQFDAEID